jgi:peptide/nickel transport system permease protein
MARFRSRFMTYPVAAFALVALIALLAVAGLADVLVGDPGVMTDNVMQPPTSDHWLGTDELGRDVLAGIVHGARISLTVGLAAAIAATLIGSILGALAGYIGGLVDLVVMRISELFQVVPSFILAVVIVALSGPGLSQVVAVIALLAWPQVARIMRGEVMRVKQLAFVDGARCLGFGEGVILGTEVIPNSITPVLPAATLIIGQAILLEAALSFFGLSNPDAVSWGRMLNSGQRFLSSAWWLSFFPGMAIFLTVLAFNLLGDGIGRALDPKSAK